MRVALVFPPEPLGIEVVQRSIRLVQARFAGIALGLWAPSESIEHYQAGLKDPTISLYERHAVRDCDVVVFHRGHHDPRTADTLAPDLAGRVYAIDFFGRILPVNRPMDSFEYPASDTHIFNRLESREPEGGFYFFPYGYLFRYTGLGPIDPFGFRITHDIERLCRRPPEHKVIAIFGGSAAWSMYAAPEETFHAQLERRLNAAVKGQQRFTVLNFGMHGHVVMNEMLAYILYCHRLKPDYVIGHDGWNDFFYGMLSDEFLLNQHDLTYQYNVEIWSQMIHGSFDRPISQPEYPLRPVALPQNVIKAYVRRKLQFQHIVEGFGGIFIWALQPSIFSKPKLSPREQRVTERELEQGGAFNLVYPRVCQLMDSFEQRVALPAKTRMVNLHQAFSRFGEDISLFGDHVHTLPAGDEKVAEIYAEYFTQNLLGGMETAPTESSEA